MADIFISYSQGSPEATQDLALDLAGSGYTVWFDSRLLPMDVFWKVIRDEIKAAKAVIVIWSPRAVDSEWVYAEAKLAHEMKKLICVCTAGVPAIDVPMPFNGYNVTSVDERRKIYEALEKLGLKAGQSAPLPKAEMEVTEVTVAWGEAKASGNPKIIEAFIRHYRDRHPFFAELAEAQLAELSAGPGGAVVEKPAGIAEIALPQAGDVFLRIEPGMHTAPIRRIGVNAAGTLIVTGSQDKTARLWQMPRSGSGSSELLRTFRVPIGEGYGGEIWAVALSPDKKWVAAGGWGRWSDHWVYIFEAATGRLVTRLGPLVNVIRHLASSPDGSRLSATLDGGEGMRLWDTASWRLLTEDKGYSGMHSYGAAFDSANRLFTVAYDGQIRRYSADGRLEAKTPAQGGKKPFSVAVHNRAAKLAVGFIDTTAVEVYDARALTRLYAADTGNIAGGNLAGVAWSADGARLFAGGRYQNGGVNPIVIWQNEGRGQRSEAPLSQDTIMQLLPCGDGLAAGATDPAFGLVTLDGTKRVWQEGVTADFRSGYNLEAFGMSANAKRVRFGLIQGGKNPLLFDLASFTAVEAPKADSELSRPRITGLAIVDWDDKETPKLDGKPIALEASETSRSLAIAPDATRFVLGTDYWLRAYLANGSELWQKQVPSVAWGVNIAGNGKLLAAAYSDGTIRWHRLSDGHELLALFVHAKDRRFIAWTPQGYYAASPGAEDLIGWQVNRGFDAAPDFYPASSFASTFRRPDIVKAALDI